ncbi:MAG: hypothetical protein ACO3NT_04235, partial [Candidatus Nanopelagicaceae bacterium]
MSNKESLALQELDFLRLGSITAERLEIYQAPPKLNKSAKSSVGDLRSHRGKLDIDRPEGIASTFNDVIVLCARAVMQDQYRGPRARD